MAKVVHQIVPSQVDVNVLDGEKNPTVDEIINRRASVDCQVCRRESNQTGNQFHESRVEIVLFRKIKQRFDDRFAENVFRGLKVNWTFEDSILSNGKTESERESVIARCFQ